MGLFQHSKQTPKKASASSDGDKRFISKSVRKEMQERGRQQFEKIVAENAALFKRDLEATVEDVKAELKHHITRQVDATIDSINAELRQHITKQIDDQLIEYKKSMKGAQDVALQSVIRSAQVVREQHERLSEKLQKDIADQAYKFDTTFKESTAQLDTMKQTQTAAMESIAGTAKALEEQHQQLTESVKENVEKQKAVLVKAVDENTAQVIEHYLMEALGDQYGLKAQLPSIIKQMEANKQAIMDDIAL